MSSQRKHIIFGSFNAEKFWRSPLNGLLPSFRDEQADVIVGAMDEMQFVFSKADESLTVTRFAMNHAHLGYLAELGFRFSNIGITNIDNTAQDTETEQSTTTALCLKVEHGGPLNGLKNQYLKLDPYALTPDHPRLTDLLDPDAFFPGAEAVKKVNSKVFSTIVSEELGKGAGGIVVNSTGALQQHAEVMLHKSALIIKDPFGVSGNGNILIKKDVTLRSIIKHLLHQEHSGKLIEFVLEPFLDKQTDFSCQGLIDETGAFEILSFHIMHNEKFRFSGIERADGPFIKKLEALGYIAYITTAAGSIFKSGYFGPVCIDSMILANGDLIPVVEINARKSMGLINHSLFMFLSDLNKNLKCRMLTLNFMVSYRLRFDQLLKGLKEDGLLFLNGMRAGILPLSANTVDINSRIMADGPFKARFYYHVIYTTFTEYVSLQEKMQLFFEKLSLKII
jgi:hypothetical protein